MKSLYFLVVVLAALAMYSEAAALQDKAVATRSNLYQGAVKPGDRMLYKEYHYRAPKTGIMQFLWIWYTASKEITFSVIHVTEVGPTQWATPTITEGGVGSNNATILLKTTWSQGFYYLVEIWGQ